MKRLIQNAAVPADLATQLPGLKAINMGYNRFGDQSDTGFEGAHSTFMAILIATCCHRASTALEHVRDGKGWANMCARVHVGLQCAAASSCLCRHLCSWMHTLAGLG